MTNPLPTFDTIRYEEPSAHVARIVLNRPDARNAQNTKLLYELNSAFDCADIHHGERTGQGHVYCAGLCVGFGTKRHGGAAENFALR